MESYLTPIRVALLDDHVIVRCGLVSYLEAEAGIEIVGSYENSDALVLGLLAAPADVLLVDYSLGPTELDGVSLIRALKRRFPESRILILSSHYDPAVVGLAFRVGAVGFIGKSQDVDHIGKAIRTVASGGVYLEQGMAYHLADVVIGCPDRAASPLRPEQDPSLIAGVPLSAREQEVIRCFLEGMSVSQIAKKSYRSVKTISSQKSMAFRKLGITSDQELFKLKYMFNV